MLKLYVSISEMVRKYLANDQRGVTAIEYGLIAGLVAVVILLGLQLTGTSLQIIYGKIATELQNAAATIPN